jgi:hypothetical protein
LSRALSQIPETKAAAFSVWTQITIQYYPLLEVIIDQIVNAPFVELVHPDTDREVVINICLFWQSLAECEMEKCAMLAIIDRALATLTPILFAISAAAPSSNCDDPED